jgi:hypothetical protein
MIYESHNRDNRKTRPERASSTVDQRLGIRDGAALKMVNRSAARVDIDLQPGFDSVSRWHGRLAWPGI